MKEALTTKIMPRIEGFVEVRIKDRKLIIVTGCCNLKEEADRITIATVDYYSFKARMKCYSPVGLLNSFKSFFQKIKLFY